MPDEQPYKRLYELEKARTRQLESELRRQDEDIAKARKSILALGHHLRIRIGCPLCYQFSHTAKDCPSNQ